ncbi:hypothetical protein N752_00115 [Desulforamulus aquiferis]|nr:hypothetical protein [Desulforamulus aquiferis]RYD07018.1 hypothetical protein N752_00115 [Desulforamulus aquiferis]
MMLQYNDILTANQLVKTYSQIAKSRTITEKVIEAEKLSFTPEQLSQKIDVKPVKDTQLISITVEDIDLSGQLGWPTTQQRYLWVRLLKL